MKVRDLVSIVGFMVALLACEPLSSMTEGRDDAVLYQLSSETMDILEHADRVVVRALGERGEAGSGERVDDRPVLASVDMTEDPRDVTRAIYRALSGARRQGLCFMPHHALVFHAGVRSVAFTICFHCSNMSNPDGQRALAIDPDALRPMLDAALTAGAGIVLTEGPDGGGWVPPRWLPVAR